MEKNKDSKILSTNLPPFFWKKVQKLIQKNQEGLLQSFLFGSESVSNLEINLENKIQSLKNQLNYFQERILNLEAERKTYKNPKRREKQALEAIPNIYKG